MTASPVVTVFGYDHINLFTPDIERTISFYRDVLGLVLVRSDRDDAGNIVFASFRTGEALLDFQPVDPATFGPPSGFNHVCLLVEPVDLSEVRVQLEQRDVVIDKGPLDRQGAYGFGSALYIRDPDGYGIELKHHGYPRLPEQEG